MTDEKKVNIYLENAKYKTTYIAKLDEEHKSILKEYWECIDKADQLKAKLESFAKKYKPLGFPTSTFESCKIKKYDGVEITVKVECFIEKNLVPIIQKQEDPHWTQNLQRFDIKTLLNSNVLTLEEKRELLGLPKEKREKHS